MNWFSQNSNFWDFVFSVAGFLFGLGVGIWVGLKHGLYGAVFGGLAGSVLGFWIWPLLAFIVYLVKTLVARLRG